MASLHSQPEVVITGMGVVSPIGTGLSDFCDALRTGRSGIDTITLFDASRFPTRFAGEAEGFDPERILAGQPIISQTHERRILLGCAAAMQAFEHARLAPADIAAARCATVLGSGVHPATPDMHTIHETGTYRALFVDDNPDPCKYRAAIERETGGENSHYPLTNRINQGTHAVARQHGVSGICQTVISACAAATQAIGHATRLIQQGRAEIAVTGGYDSMIFPFGVYAFCLLQLMSTCNDDPQHAMKPFDRQRDGFALGEGAGILMLASRAHAEARGAAIYGRIAGYGSSVDAYKVTDPHPEGRGAVVCMQRALRDAGCTPEEVDYINAHGTGTLKNDRIETAAIKEVFGDHARRLAVSSTKSMIGHLMSAGGALELIATVLGMNHGFIPPTINYHTPDPDCDLDYVPNHARQQPMRVAVSNSFGLGGQNGSIVVVRD